MNDISHFRDGHNNYNICKLEQMDWTIVFGLTWILEGLVKVLMHSNLCEEQIVFVGGVLTSRHTAPFRLGLKPGLVFCAIDKWALSTPKYAKDPRKFVLDWT